MLLSSGTRDTATTEEEKHSPDSDSWVKAISNIPGNEKEKNNPRFSKVLFEAKEATV